MKPCECCQDARDWPGTVAARTFCEGCLWCGARLIKAIKMLPIGVSESNQRRGAMLAVWVARGHSEAEIRRLVKLDDVPLQPLPELSDVPRKRGK